MREHIATPRQRGATRIETDLGSCLRCYEHGIYPPPAAAPGSGNTCIRHLREPSWNPSLPDPSPVPGLIGEGFELPPGPDSEMEAVWVELLDATPDTGEAGSWPHIDWSDVLTNSAARPAGAVPGPREPLAVRRLRSMARTAAEVDGAAARLAAGLFQLRQARPRYYCGSTDRALALMVASADWRSGKRARPGLEDTAAVLGCSTRTVTRQWEVIVTGGAAVRTVQGGRISLDEHERLVAQGAVCFHGLGRKAAAEEIRRARAEGLPTCRLRDRAEFDVKGAAALGLTTDEITMELLEEAASLLAEVSESSSQATESDEDQGEALGTSEDQSANITVPDPETKPVPRAPDAPECPHRDRVYPSTGGSSLKHPSDRTYHPCVPPGLGGDHRIASKKRRSTRQERRLQNWRARQELPAEAVAIARALIPAASERGAKLPQLRGVPVHVLAQALVPLLAHEGLTAENAHQLVQHAVAVRNVKMGYYYPPLEPKKPVRWVIRLLKEILGVVPVPPPNPRPNRGPDRRRHGSTGVPQRLEELPITAPEVWIRLQRQDAGEVRARTRQRFGAPVVTPPPVIESVVSAVSTGPARPNSTYRAARADLARRRRKWRP